MPLWIGHFMHNFRSAWDHIAYELIRAVPGLDPTERTMFPLLIQEPERPPYISPEPGPHPDAMDIVESIQPYKEAAAHHDALNEAGDESVAKEWHGFNALATLNHLDIVDKHHELLAVAASVELPTFGGPFGVNVVDTWAWGGAVRDGDAVMWAIIEPSHLAGALDGHVVLTTKLAPDLLSPCHCR